MDRTHQPPAGCLLDFNMDLGYVMESAVFAWITGVYTSHLETIQNSQSSPSVVLIQSDLEMNSVPNEIRAGHII